MQCTPAQVRAEDDVMIATLIEVLDERAEEMEANRG